MPSPPPATQVGGANSTSNANAEANVIAHANPNENTNTSASAVPEKRKRTKYAAKACVECKRRKVKCCGEQPCQRCRRRMMDCVFTTDETSADNQNIDRLLGQIKKMQTQIDTLTGTVDSFRSANSAATIKSPLSPPSQKKSSHGTISTLKSNPSEQPLPSSPSTDDKISFHGLTTSSFNFGIARQTLRSRGITEVGRTSGSSEDDATREPSPMPSPSLSPHREDHHRRSSIDPLWGMNREEALRLCHVYEEEMGIMYPILDLKTVTNQVNALYTHLNPSSERTTQPSGEERPLSDEDVNILKLVFACALTAEANGNSELAMSIFRGVRDVASDLVWKPPSIKRLVLITLVSIYLFQIDEEAIAWRTIGTAQRLCLEMGLHRSETYPQHAIVSYGKENVLKLFWSVYTLDMRFSMGTGMPYHLDSSDIDPSLPRPVNVPYLNTMINYNRLAEKVWRFITASSRNQHGRKEEMAYLDWQVTQWYNSIPQFLKLPFSNTPNGNDSSNISNSKSPQRDSTRSIWRLKALLYLRANLMKILIYRPILYTPALIAQSPVEAATVVDIAKDTICFITHLNQSTDIYQLQQVVFNWFLISALAVLFLAVAHAPAQFTSNCKDEFYMALSLIEGFSMHSYVSQRLWKSIKGLRRLAPQIGLLSQNNSHNSQTQSQHLPVRDEMGSQPSHPNVNIQQPGSESTSSRILINNREANTTAIPQRFTVKQEQQQQQQQEQTPNPTSSIATTPTSPDDFLFTDGSQMSRELMDWFEAMGEPNPAVVNTTAAAAAATNMADGTAIDVQQTAAAGGGLFNNNNGNIITDPSWASADDFMFGYGGELASILRDCF